MTSKLIKIKMIVILKICVCEGIYIYIYIFVFFIVNIKRRVLLTREVRIVNTLFFFFYNFFIFKLKSK